MFTYENWKNRKDDIEELYDYGYVQAWTCEYYMNLMQDLEKTYNELLETPNLTQLPYTQGKIDMLKRILYNTLEPTKIGDK